MLRLAAADTGLILRQVIPPQFGGQMMYSNDTCTSSVFALLPPIDIHWTHNNHCVGECHLHGHFHEHPEFYSLLARDPLQNRSCATQAGADANCSRAWNVSLQGVPGQGFWNTELCMSNPQMREALIARAIAKLRWDRDNLGGVQFIGVADNDQASGAGACECEACTAARKRDAGPAIWNSTHDPNGEHSGEVDWGGQSGLSLSVANQVRVQLIGHARNNM